MGIDLVRNQLRTPQWRGYTFDGNKNVSELVHFETRNGIAAHYFSQRAFENAPGKEEDISK